MMAAIRAFSVCLLAASLSGCQGFPSNSEDLNQGIRYGLGLDMSDLSTLTPGPFMEGDENVTEIASKLNETFTDIFARCQAPPEEAADFHEALRNGDVLTAVGYGFEACRNDGDLGLTLAREAIREGTEREVYEEWRDRAQAVVSEQAELISSLPPPGSVVEAEVQALLMHRNEFRISAAVTGQRMFDDYLTNPSNELNLASALLNAIGPVYEANATREFIRSFPWSKGTCTPPDIEALSKRHAERIELILNISARFETLDDPTFIPINTIYGSTLKGTKPAYHYYAERNWWPGLLRMERALTWDLATLQTFHENVLPTQEEAQYLFAKHQHEQRALDWEEQMDSFEGQLHLGMPWEEHPDQLEARSALALDSMHSGFSELHCEPAHSE